MGGKKTRSNLQTHSKQSTEQALTTFKKNPNNFAYKALKHTFLTRNTEQSTYVHSYSMNIHDICS